MLKYTRIELELLKDINMVLFFDKSIKGGLSQCSKRYSTANNKYMREYNPSEPSRYIMYYDVNNLYGYAMCEYLPTGGFSWVTEEVENFNVMKIPEKSETGYVLEVDLEYPEEIYDIQSDLPFCPERSTPPNGKYPKLLATLNAKKKIRNSFKI